MSKKNKTKLKIFALLKNSLNLVRSNLDPDPFFSSANPVSGSASKLIGS